MSAWTMTKAFLKWKTRSMRRERPLWVALYVTRRCNLSCHYCKLGGRSKPDPSTSEILARIDRIKQLGIAMVVITGGEPALRPDMPEIIRHCRACGLVTCLNTNGTLLTERYIVMLAQAGMDILNISVDGMHARRDRYKAIDSLRKILAQARAIRSKYGFEVVCSQVLSDGNIDEVEDFLNEMKTLDLPVSPNICYPVLAGFANEDGLAKLNSGIGTFLAKKEKGHAVSISNEYLQFARRHLNGHKRWECCAGRSFFAVDVDGGISICDRLEMDGFDHLGLSLHDLSPDDLDVLAAEADRMRKTGKCTEQCLANCAFETSYFLEHPIRYSMDVRSKNGNGRGLRQRRSGELYRVSGS
jgi:MoaA/NifB/PqqE/SkfB family radical SAM enzyme